MLPLQTNRLWFEPMGGRSTFVVILLKKKKPYQLCMKQNILHYTIMYIQSFSSFAYIEIDQSVSAC